jgi:hypothetical protein
MSIALLVPDSIVSPEHFPKNCKMKTVSLKPEARVQVSRSRTPVFSPTLPAARLDNKGPEGVEESGPHDIGNKS